MSGVLNMVPYRNLYKTLEMENDKTPKPASEEYDVENPQNLNVPKFNSSTDKRESSEKPAVENMNDQELVEDNRPPDTDLGNERDDHEDDKERIISK